MVLLVAPLSKPLVLYMEVAQAERLLLVLVVLVVH
jgi:hypothetical protein